MKKFTKKVKEVFTELAKAAAYTLKNV